MPKYTPYHWQEISDVERKVEANGQIFAATLHTWTEGRFAGRNHWVIDEVDQTGSLVQRVALNVSEDGWGEMDYVIRRASAQHSLPVKRKA